MYSRTAIPTKDRPGNVSLAIMSVALNLGPDDELFLYDDGDRPASSDYGVRFALDIAVQRGASVVIRRGKANGIGKARALMLEDALSDNMRLLRMVDDDVVMPTSAWESVWHLLSIVRTAQYVVPSIALANNEAGIEGFGKIGRATGSHDQQFVLGKTGHSDVVGGAWTNDIALDLTRFDVQSAIDRLRSGPPVVEDYVLTAPLRGLICHDATIWHCMSPDQGERAWNSAALAYLRKSLSTNGGTNA